MYKLSLLLSPILCRDNHQAGEVLPNKVQKSNEEEDSLHQGDHYAQVPNRALLELSGEETPKFLQGLVTNNILSLNSTSMQGFYTAFLDPAGRILFDAFIYLKQIQDFPPTYLVECDSRIVKSLRKHFTRYMLRSKVEIKNISQDYGIWNIWGKDLLKKIPDLLDFAIIDHRYKEMGIRKILPANSKPILPDSFTELPSDEYTIRRILHGIPEGVEDFPPGNVISLQANLDYMGGIDFRKGCYIGQELTFRTYHTGVTRRRILPVQFYRSDEPPPEKLSLNRLINLPPPPPFTDILQDGSLRHKRGFICSFRHNIGLAMIKLEFVNKDTLIVSDGHGGYYNMKPFIPIWWPKGTFEEIMVHQSTEKTFHNKG
ncbi:hypothetical protein G9A89_003747 [Geosiphon pyriformis]|nr:hypothetical protein G9A89_003747 [Geosiphon pyriformis]